MRSPAFSLIEVLIAMSLFAIIMFGGYSAFVSVKQNQELSLSTEHLVDTLRRAHIFSRDGRDEKEWGVQATNEFTYELITRADEDEPSTIIASYPLPTSVRIAAPFTLWFLKGTGHLELPYAFSLVNTRNIETTVYVQQSGSIRYTYDE